jgi:hypothetical protein
MNIWEIVFLGKISHLSVICSRTLITSSRIAKER